VRWRESQARQILFDLLIHCLPDGLRQDRYHRRFDNGLVVPFQPVNVISPVCPAVPTTVRQMWGQPGVKGMRLGTEFIAFAEHVNGDVRYWERPVFFHEADHVALNG